MQLSELVTYGVLSKNIQPGFPLYVEYCLTPLGESILPILAHLNEWGSKNKAIAKKIANYTAEEGINSEKKTTGYSAIC
jgi:DNA-binding HxlR family transcriptional regulator